jgi:predicted transcriptional regulator of viral defense system
MSSSSIKKLKKIVRNRCFTTKEANEIGVSSRMLSFYIEKKEIERVERGLYILPDCDVGEEYSFHELALLSKSIKGSVICLISALNYWDMTDEIEREYWLAIPNNYPIPKGKKKVRFIRPRDLKTGVLEKEIANIKVKITTPERSVCEAFKYLDEEAAITSLSQYMTSDITDINKLMTMATMLKTNKLLAIMNELASSVGKSYPSMDKDKFKSYVKWLEKQRKLK